MDLILLFVFVLAFINVKIGFSGGYLATCLKREQATAVNGVFATSRIKIGNPVLNWLGEHTFEIYILQRLPMMALSGININQYVYFLLCVVITALIAFWYHRLMGALLMA